VITRHSVILAMAILVGICAAKAGAAPAASQDQETSNQAVQKHHKKNDKKDVSPPKEAGKGGEDIGKGVGKGAGSLAKGTAGAAGDLVTLHPVDAGASLGKGAVGLGKDAGVGTAKGTAKIGKGAGRGVGHLFRRMFGKKKSSTGS